MEVARVAYAMAKATRGLSFREAVELILYAGGAAQHARQGRSILTLLHRALQLPGHLGDAVEEIRGAVEDLRLVGDDMRRDFMEMVRGYRAELARSVAEAQEVAREARDLLREASSGGWVGPAALL
ncbi:hypothetical protein, partial [Thermus sediminis]|uniref:hypothetical protein n=1 Tax=Thermus sediminis TaxID=1761908 RepID=UPI001300549E